MEPTLLPLLPVQPWEAGPWKEAGYDPHPQPEGVYRDAPLLFVQARGTWRGEQLSRHAVAGQITGAGGSLAAAYVSVEGPVTALADFGLHECLPGRQGGLRRLRWAYCGWHTAAVQRALEPDRVPIGVCGSCGDEQVLLEGGLLQDHRQAGTGRCPGGLHRPGRLIAYVHV